MSDAPARLSAGNRQSVDSSSSRWLKKYATTIRADPASPMQSVTEMSIAFFSGLGGGAVCLGQSISEVHRAGSFGKSSKK